MLAPFSALFGASVRLRNLLYDSGRLRARRLRGRVVSIGNISVGGAGKTPFVIALGQMLKQRGIAFDVFSRGYRRKTKGVLQVDPAGSPADFGDEPLLIAQQLGVPVIVGERRYEAGLWSEKKYGQRLHLLDDGFQHRQLARDFDIVLLTAADLSDRLLPAGRLREPLAEIRRADAIVLAPEIDATALPLRPEQHVWRLRRTVQLDTLPTSASPAVSVLGFCAIARPKRFFDDLRSSGIELANEVAFRDHHSYTAADVSYLTAKAAQSRAVGFVTTEKDSINLGALASRLQPLHIAHLKLELLDAGAVLNTLITRLRLLSS
jgi:tetraacyldisaccharide 4'-kinase